MKTKLFLLWGIVFVLSMNGCDDSKIPFGYVTGKLTIDGKPAPENVKVYFYPQFQGGSYSIGRTDAQGNFEMKFSTTRKGVEAGLNKVQIENPDEGRAAVPRAVLKANNKTLWEQAIDVKKGKQTLNFNIDTSLKTEEKAVPRRNQRREEQLEKDQELGNNG
ncbi:MAG: hypothetical protein LBJ67_15280 [Planctomycetaceae bacterium]|jgi:hypothetical protein|nr:hypothetical protein [Planctomycetaceae bacterium]